jgi:hypothetical protein
MAFSPDRVISAGSGYLLSKHGYARVVIGGGNWQPAVVAALGFIAFVVVIVAVRIYLVSDGRAIRAANRRNRRRPTVESGPDGPQITRRRSA